MIRLRNPNPGSSTDANDIILTASGPELKYNPGRIDPENAAAWTDSRKPLAAEWETLDGRNKFFTINVHFMSKGGSSSLEGDPRPPVNGGVETRMTQADVVAVSSIRDRQKHVYTKMTNQKYVELHIHPPLPLPGRQDPRRRRL